MTLTLTLTFLVVFILAVIYSKTTYKTSQQHYIKWLSHASSLSNITVYCIWIIGCLLMIMQILLMSGVYNVSLFTWVLFEAPLIGSVIVLLLTLGGIKRQMTHDNDERKKQRRVIVKTLFLQMICVSFTSVLFAINLLVQEI